SAMNVSSMGRTGRTYRKKIKKKETALCTLRTHTRVATRRAHASLAVRACEAACWPILFYRAVCEPAVARHTSVFTDCRFMNKVDAQASAQAVCGFTISHGRSYIYELTDNGPGARNADRKFVQI
ncbi:hypothetical protein ALC56_08516, partial [Trachymyrmex septentrionalis]